MAGGWSAWTAVRSMLPTSRRMSLRSGGRGAVAATAPTRGSALWRSSRMGPMSCLVAGWPVGYGTGEMTLAKAVLVALQKGMLCLADRQFFGLALWQEALGTGADLVWRVKRNRRLSGDRRWPDGSYESRLSASARDRRHKTNGVIVRVVDDRRAGVADAEPIDRLVTSILEHDKAPAQELAALDHERWEIETALDALKTRLRGAKIVLRSRPRTSYGRILRPGDGPLRHPQPDPRGRAESRRGPRPALVPACRARGPPQAPHRHRRSPLGRERLSITPSSTKSSKNASHPAETGEIVAASSAR